MMICDHREIIRLRGKENEINPPTISRHFTWRNHISRAERISQIPEGIYFVENTPHLSTTNVGYFLGIMCNFNRINTMHPGVRLAMLYYKPSGFKLKTQWI